ncbi:PEP/pyruvate-binding domain-containing protein [Mobilicoccus caccae]|uniref:Pyruvate, water dikinase n=1 Tax=Mobilicoccus caccae TaxID=1859295 RepID=A0ABQ6IME8_9MICO|nr:PEP/pyruvate-binding domain-containing protein [Mobilicoccus caccae]GMA39114.1 hypothetical protein GCM10025883_11590 [Mobilicoccus caccae]
MNVIPLDDATPATSGGKAATLATLRQAGITVPDGFVITTDAYRDHAAAPSTADVRQRAPALRPPSAELLDEIDAALTDLFGAPDAGHVAVRSSAIGEDTPSASAAGQHETVLAVRGTRAVADAVTRCWASLWNERAIAYRRAHPAPAESPAMAVLVQRLVDAEVSGVAFTTDPRIVEATPGLGEALVGGRITPDSWRIERGRVIDHRPGVLTTRTDRRGDHLVDLPAPPRLGPCLSTADVLAVDAAARRAQDVLGHPVDLEWALAGGRVRVLQARPITASPVPTSTRPVIDEPDEPDGPDEPGDRSTTILWGAGAAAGRAHGPARIVHGPTDFACVRAGDILICRTTDPAWTPLFRIAAGVVTETGGVLSHAAIVARELGIPAVLAVPGVTTTIEDGDTISLDGATGRIDRQARP